MLALSPQIFPAFGWPPEEATIQEQYNYRDQQEEASENFLHVNNNLHSSRPQLDFDRSPPSATAISGDPTVAKKLNHNASERDRRKKINCLYATLRSLLPDADQTKKLSIPGTVSRALKYIPELQQQVERLTQKKEELVSKISKQDDLFHQEKQRKRSVPSSLTSISANYVGDREVIVQIFAHKLQKCAFSDILLLLDEEGLILTNSSTSESFGGRVFYNLHLQVERTQQLDCEALTEKLLSLYDKSEQTYP